MLIAYVTLIVACRSESPPSGRTWPAKRERTRAVADSPLATAAEAMKQVFGKDTEYIRSGGSIPIVGVFDRYLGIPSVMMGFGLPDDNLHAPNE